MAAGNLEKWDILGHSPCYRKVERWGNRPSGWPLMCSVVQAFGSVKFECASSQWWEIRTGCGNVNVVEGDAGRAACVLFCKEMSAYGV